MTLKFRHRRDSSEDRDPDGEGGGGCFKRGNSPFSSFTPLDEVNCREHDEGENESSGKEGERGGEKDDVGGANVEGRNGCDGESQRRSSIVSRNNIAMKNKVSLILIHKT